METLLNQDVFTYKPSYSKKKTTCNRWLLTFKNVVAPKGAVC